MMGGTATVDVHRRTAGVDSVTVTCKVDGLGGWRCSNAPGQGAEATCAPIPMQATAAPSRWLASQAGEILPALESGSPAQIEHAVAALHADPILQAELTSDRSAAATDHDRDDPAAKASKQGKQGKHRGKGHRR
jgi:hypothetical protein